MRLFLIFSALIAVGCASQSIRNPSSAVAGSTAKYKEIILDLPKNIYSLPVHVFAPEADFNGESAAVNIHLLGFDQGQGSKRYFNEFDWFKFLRDSQFPGVIVVPETVDRTETYYKHFGNRANWIKFVNAVQLELKNKLGISEIRDLILTAHSGGGYSVANLSRFSLDWKKLRAIGIFDGLYQNQNVGIIELARQAPAELRLYSSYMVKSDTEPYNLALIASIDEFGIVESVVEGLDYGKFDHFSAFSSCYPKFLKALQVQPFIGFRCAK